MNRSKVDLNKYENMKGFMKIKENKKLKKMNIISKVL